MIRLTWRQFRTQAAVAAAALAVLAVILAVTGTRLAHLYDTSVASCGSEDACAGATNAFLTSDRSLQLGLNALMLVVPAILGIFWGAPLIARELETGTHRLAWTQSVTRPRWLAAKLGLVGVWSVGVAGLLSLMVTWWFGPLDGITANRFAPGPFDERAIVAMGYAAFAFALGAAMGLLIRRTLPAMAVTLVVFIAARLAFVQWIRPHLMPPVHRTITLVHAAIGFGIRGQGGPPTLFPEGLRIPNAWVYAPRILDGDGHPLTPSVVARACPNIAVPAHDQGGPATGVPAEVVGQLRACLRTIGRTYHEAVAFQPAGRYWTFQWIETAIFLVAALALAGLCFWWIRRRVS